MNKKKKLIISIICIIVALIVLFSIIMVQVTSAATAKLFTSPDVQVSDIDYESEFTGDSTQNLSPENHAGEGYVKRAETPYLELYLKVDGYRLYEQDFTTGEYELAPTDRQRYDIAVYDKQSGKLWRSLVPDENIDYENLNESLTSQMQSLVTFTYYDLLLGNNRETEVNPMESDVDCTINVSNIRNGVRISYDFPSLNISFALDFKIYEDKFDVVVPREEIKESVQDNSKIMAARAEAQGMIQEYRNLLNSINANKLEGDQVTENTVAILESNIAIMKKDLMTLSDQSESGGSTLSSVRELMQTAEQFFMDLQIYDQEGIYAEQLQRMQELNGEIEEAFAGLDSNTLAGLVSINILPYFGSETSGADGYVFYPDKSGAISRFNVYHPTSVGFIEQDIYSNQKSDVATYFDAVDDTETEEDDTNTREAFTTFQMPVYGIKSGDNAFVAIIAEGDSDAGINYTPSSPEIDVNRIYGIFHMRNITQNMNSSGELSDVIDSTLIDQDRRIRYEFLHGDQADYAGMAVKYREHLEHYGLLKVSDYMDTEDVPMFLRVYMGVISYNTGVFPEYVSLTSFEETTFIVNALRAAGVTGDINTVLTGWSTEAANGSLPDYDRTPEGSNGGVSGLKDLVAYAKENNMTLSLDNQYTFGADDDMTFSDRDTATTKNYGNFTEEAWGYHMFNPTVVYNRGLESITKFKDFGVDSISFAEEGRVVYNDYNTRAPYTRAQTKATMQKLVSEAKNQLGYASVNDANIYMAAQADWFQELMASDTRYLLSDEGVPFYQMVLHGSIIYTGEAQNMHYDMTTQTLKEIEYGYIPYYLLTYNEPDISTSRTRLYGTLYTEWTDQIGSYYQEYKEKMGDLWKVKMTDHETIEDGLVCVTYENGARVLVNYNTTAKQYDGVTVEAQDYTVIR